MNTLLSRQRYLNKILPFVHKPIIKVLTGQRRVGKSSLLLSLIDHLSLTLHSYCYVDKEDMQRDHIKNYEDLYTYAQSFHIVMIDEIQEIEDWERAIRSLRSAGKDVYITGSNSQLLSGELASFLSGRYIEIAVYPLDWKEFREYFHLSSSKENLLTYINFGGMPYYLQLGLQEHNKLYAKDVFNTIVLKDIIKRYGIRNVSFFEKLIEYLAKNIGSLFGSLSLSNFLAEQGIDISPRVINEYISYANKALFLHSVDRYDIIGKKLFERKQKHYFTDIGLKNAVYPYTINDIGRSLENIVYSNLIANDRIVTTGEIADKEIDFIATKHDKKIYVQVSYLLNSEKTLEREFGVYKRLDDHWPKYVVSLDDVVGVPVEGIIQKQVRKFLEEDI